MQVRFGREQLSPALWDESFALLVRHWREVAHYQDIQLNPDRQRYAVAESNGGLRVFTARRAEPCGVGTIWPLIGYALFFVGPNPHYAQSVQAVQDVLYLDPSARGRTSLQFIEFCDDALRAEGVQAVYHHSKVAHDFGRLLEHIGYEKVDVIYARRLDRGRDSRDRDRDSDNDLQPGRSEPATAEGQGSARGSTAAE